MSTHTSKRHLITKAWRKKHKMKCVSFLLCLCCISFVSSANELLEKYNHKLRQCVSEQKAKKALRKNQIQLSDFKYVLLINNLRIARCSKVEEMQYLLSAATEEPEPTLSQYNSFTLTELSTDEIMVLQALSVELADYNLETDFSALFE